MVHHVRRHHNRRDDDSIPAAPTGIGLTAASIAADTTVATPATLVLNSAAATDANTPQGVQFSASATNTFTSPLASGTDSADVTPPSPSPSSASSSASSEIPMGTVIGVCLAALAGAVLLILIGLWLYRRGTQPRRRPSTARKPVDKDRAWGKLEDDHEDRWESQHGKYQQKGVVSVGPMEKLTMFKNPTPSMHTFSKSQDQEPIPSVAPFAHPFAHYTPDLPKDFAEHGDGAPMDPPKRPFLARVDPISPISWDGDTVGRDSFLSLSSNPAISQATDMAIPTPQLTSSEPHHWQSAVVMNFDSPADETQRGRSDVAGAESLRKSSNNPFFGARASMHSTHSRSQSRSRSPSNSSAPDPVTMPTPPAIAVTREEKGKYRVSTPSSTASSRAPSTIIAHNPFSDTNELLHPITPIVPFKPEHISQDSQDRAMASLLAALGPSATHEQVQERLRVASMNGSVLSESVYTETDGDDATLHQSWPLPPSRA